MNELQILFRLFCKWFNGRLTFETLIAMAFLLPTGFFLDSGKMLEDRLIAVVACAVIGAVYIFVFTNKDKTEKERLDLIGNVKQLKTITANVNAALKKNENTMRTALSTNNQQIAQLKAENELIRKKLEEQQCPQ